MHEAIHICPVFPFIIKKQQLNLSFFCFKQTSCIIGVKPFKRQLWQMFVSVQWLILCYWKTWQTMRYTGSMFSKIVDLLVQEDILVLRHVLNVICRTKYITFSTHL